MPVLLILLLFPFLQAPAPPPAQAPRPPLSRQPAGPSAPSVPLEKSAYLAFVDHDFIFTVELVKPGVPLFNFVSMSDSDQNLFARNIRVTLENRKVPGEYFMVDTGDPKEPMIVPSVHMRARSSFGVRLQGNFGTTKEVMGATVKVGNEDLKLVPLTSFQFENLALKVDRINLGSPDFSDDWRVLKLETIGSRGPAVRR